MALAASLAACGAATGSSAQGRLAVVAGEDTWGSIARQLGGSDVAVTSIITSPNSDPHLYTASAADAAAVAGARLVIDNGAHYDDFMGQLLSASGTSPDVLTVASLAHARGSNPNPHFWYSFRDVVRVAAAITAAYVRLDPAHRAAYESRHAAFTGSLVPLGRVLDQIQIGYGWPKPLASVNSTVPPVAVAYTERVPGYVVQEAGLDNRTPPGFAKSVEDGTEPSLADTLAMQHLLTSREVRVLLYNVQTVSAVTSAALAAARSSGVQVVDVAETLPARYRTYVAWQLAQDSALLDALRRTGP